MSNIMIIFTICSVMYFIFMIFTVVKKFESSNLSDISTFIGAAISPLILLISIYTLNQQSKYYEYNQKILESQIHAKDTILLIEKKESDTIKFNSYNDFTNKINIEGFKSDEDFTSITKRRSDVFGWMNLISEDYFNKSYKDKMFYKVVITIYNNGSPIYDLKRSLIESDSFISIPFIEKLGHSERFNVTLYVERESIERSDKIEWSHEIQFNDKNGEVKKIKISFKKSDYLIEQIDEIKKSSNEKLEKLQKENAKLNLIIKEKNDSESEIQKLETSRIEDEISHNNHVIELLKKGTSFGNLQETHGFINYFDISISQME